MKGVVIDFQSGIYLFRSFSVCYEGEISRLIIMDPLRKTPGGRSGRQQQQQRRSKEPGPSPSAAASTYSSMFPFGSPINTSRRSVLSPGALNLSANRAAVDGEQTDHDVSLTGSHHVLRGRVRAQDVYGGPLMFGGNSISKGIEESWLFPDIVFRHFMLLLKDRLRFCETIQ